MNSILIADSGATKADWRVVSADGTVRALTTSGISPVFLDRDGIAKVLREELLPALEDVQIQKVFFYAAGIVSDEVSGKVCDALAQVFPDAACEAASDLLAAARALCGDKPGIACILGTGSNSCFYDGEKIVSNVRAGGFILGDEASGAWFGKQLLADFVKGLLPQNLTDELVRRFGIDYPTIVQKVYREELPSRYLASFAPFIQEHGNHPYIKNLLRNGFEAFLLRNVAQYDYRRYPVHFTGSVAWHFRELLSRCLTAAGMRQGTIIQRPIESLTEYHRHEQLSL